MSRSNGSYFTSPFELELTRKISSLLDDNYYRVKESQSFVVSGESDETFSITVPRNYLTNGSTIPDFIRPLISRWIGFQHPAVVLHDYLDEYLLIEKKYYKIPINRYHLVFYFIEALKVSGVSKRHCSIIQFLYYVHLLFTNVSRPSLNTYKQYIESVQFMQD